MINQLYGTASVNGNQETAENISTNDNNDKGAAGAKEK